MVLNSCSDSCRVDLPVRHCVVKDELANPDNSSDTAIASPWTLPLGEIDKIELVRSKLLLDALPVRAKVTLGALDRMQHAASSSGSMADGAVDDRRSENRHPQPCGSQTLLVVLGLLIWRAFWVRGQERRQTSIRPCLRKQLVGRCRAKIGNILLGHLLRNVASSRGSRMAFTPPISTRTP
ncbi:hypothetical protein PsYK624_134520 [Phanerochaete sordida]|uniref:Uncharacterized protein n=1 Tax=Phanerochaete sordida TaxID=48140 RepID=A0A9P3GKL8_9APHY|nr:hypothetical protein PsYK624_134520 [Phanerochaete sordida]